MTGHSLFEWTNWAFGLVAVSYVVFSELRESRRKRQLRRLAFEVEPSDGRQTTRVAGPDLHRDLLNDQLRSILIQLGVDNQPFSVAVQRAHRFGADKSSVEASARALRDSKLLRFSEPLEENTRIRLN